MNSPTEKSAPENRSRSRGVHRQPRKARFDDLVEKLKAVALSQQPGEKLPGVYELSESLGVSVTTLTSALDELEACRIIDRRPGVGIYTSPDAGKRAIALVCDPMFFRADGASPFWDMLIKQARLRADGSNELLDFHFASIAADQMELPSSLVADINSRRVDGVLYIGTFEAGVEWIESKGIPVVVFAGPGPHTVSINEAELISAGAEALGRRGRRRIALAFPGDRVTDMKHAAVYRERRLTAFRAGLNLGGAPIVPKLICEPVTAVCAGPWIPTVSTQEQGYRMASDWLRLPVSERPDGIVVTNDMMTLGVLAAAQDADLAVGSDFDIASHANTGSSLLIGWQERIVTLNIDPATIASVMFQMLEALMNGQLGVPEEVKIRPVVRFGDKLRSAD